MKERITDPTQPMVHEVPESAAGNLFDLRLLIGGLFVFYGVVLIITGIFASAAELHKAAGININLWMGIGMLVLGLLFLAWQRLAPLKAEPAPAPESMQPVPPPRARTQQRSGKSNRGSRAAKRTRR